jgi:hypothetical protein
MSKQQSNFLNQWLSIQVVGSVTLAIATQAIVTLLTLLFQIDNAIVIYLLRVLACLFSFTIQGYLQWCVLKQFIKTLDRRWMFTSVAVLPINILNWALIHLGIKSLTLDEDGTVLIILAIIGAVVGGIGGRVVGNLQKSLLKQSLYWRSLWLDWDREQLLAGALSGVVTSIIIGLASISQVMYGFIVGDTIQDVFQQAKILK